jgi:hypothetical protein
VNGRARWSALAMAAVLFVYVGFTAFTAIQLIAAPEALARVLGWALLVLPVVGAWFAGAEIVFGFRAERLARSLEQTGGLPTETLPARSSGRIERDAADASFARYAAEAEANPDSWPHWFRLSLAYDAARDRRRARWAMREAIRIARSAGRR